MIINHNLPGMNAIRNMNTNSTNASKSMQKLSSGLRINSAADDAAGLAISEKMRGQIRGLDQASANAQDGISLTQTAEGALNETTSILQRMRELAVQSSNDTNTGDDRTAIQTEMNQLTSEVNRIGNTTQFNTKKLLDGSISNTAGTVTASTLTAGTTTLSNLSLDKKSSLTAGDYSVKVADTIAKSGSAASINTAPGTGVASVSVANDASIDNGTGYKVKLEQSTAQVYDATASTLDTNHTGIDSVTVGNTSLSAGPHTVTINRNDSVTGATGGNGIANTTTLDAGTKMNAGTYNLQVTKVLDGTIGNAGAGTNSITGVQIASNADNGVIGAGLNIQFAATADPTKYTAQLFAADGTTALSAKVILDDNTQHYDFYDTTSTSKIGVSFDTVNGVNANVNAQSGDLTQATQSFGVGAKLDVIDTNGKEGTPGASIAFTTLSAADASTTGVTTASIAYGGGNVNVNLTAAGALQAGNTATFTVGNALTASLDGGTAVGFSPAGSVSFTSQGVTLNMDSDINKYTNGKTATIGIKNDAVTMASLTDASDVQLAGTSKIQVAASSSYNFGNGVSFTTGATLANSTGTFDVTSATQTNATLTNTTTGTTVATKNVTGAGTIDFGKGLKVDTADKTNGTATFSISGSVEDDSLTMQIGANNGQGFSVGVNDMRANALKISGQTASDSTGVTGASYVATASVSNGTDNNNTEFALDLGSASKATAAIEVIDNATKTVSAERAKLGAYQNRLEHTINNLGTSSENLTSAESRIRDVDMAKEMANFSKNNILAQAAQAMLAQANQMPTQVLQLLR